MAEVAEVQALRAFEKTEGCDCLVGVEGEVAAALEDEGRYANSAELRACRTGCEIRADCRNVGLRDGISQKLQLFRPVAVAGDVLGKPEHDARAHVTLGRERLA